MVSIFSRVLNHEVAGAPFDRLKALSRVEGLRRDGYLAEARTGGQTFQDRRTPCGATTKSILP